MVVILSNPRGLIEPSRRAPKLIDHRARTIDTSWDMWFADPEKLEMDNRNHVSRWASMKSSGGRNLTQPNSACRPLFMAGSLGRRGALRFGSQAGAVPMQFDIDDFPAGAAASWTKVAVLAAPAYGPAGKRNLWSSGGPLEHRMELLCDVKTSEHVFMRGGAGLAARVKVRRPVDKFFLLACSFDHVSGRLAGNINGAGWVVSKQDGAMIDAIKSAIGARPGDSARGGGHFDLAAVGAYSQALHLPEGLNQWEYYKNLMRQYFASDDQFARSIL